MIDPGGHIGTGSDFHSTLAIFGSMTCTWSVVSTGRVASVAPFKVFRKFRRIRCVTAEWMSFWTSNGVDAQPVRQAAGRAIRVKGQRAEADPAQKGTRVHSQLRRQAERVHQQRPAPKDGRQIGAQNVLRRLGSEPFAASRRAEVEGLAPVVETMLRGHGIDGQVADLLRMVEDDRYCVHTLIQINAVRAALHKVEEQILRDHVSHGVADAFTSGNPIEQRHKVAELIDTIGRMTRSRAMLKGKRRRVKRVITGFLHQGDKQRAGVDDRRADAGLSGATPNKAGMSHARMQDRTRSIIRSCCLAVGSAPPVGPGARRGRHPC